MEFERFLQIGQRLLFALALAGNIKFQALRDVPIALTPNGCGGYLQTIRGLGYRLSADVAMR